MAESIGTIISLTGQSIINLLKAEVGFAEGDVVLKSPVDAGASAKVSMFLFQLHENEYLRNKAKEDVDSTGLRPPPLALDLYFLITPLSVDPTTALGHLESIMRVFYDNAVLQAPLLPAGVVDAGNEQIRLTPHRLSLEDTNRLWGMFPDKSYALSVTYVVSPVNVPSGRVFPITRVVEKTTHIHQMGTSE